MDCPKCKIPMEKEHINTLNEDKISYFTNWCCQKCGFRKKSEYEAKF